MSDILDKLRKLQALKDRAGTEQEAAVASLRIQEILTRHNLDIGVLTLEKEEGCEQGTGTTKRRPPDHWPILAHAVKDLLDVEFFVRGNDLRGWQYFFIGLKANTEAAVLTFQYLIDSIESLLRVWKKEPDAFFGRLWRDVVKKKKDYRAFRLGASERIRSMIAEGKRQHSVEATALVFIGNALAQRMMDSMNFEKVKMHSPTVRAAEARSYQDGFMRGGAINPHGATCKKIRGRK